jgi:serine/threonine-protein kinase
MIGKTISHYEILEKLGEGGMGVVYKAQDLELDRIVALKFLSPLLTADEVERKRFEHEARAVSALDHPNICTFYELGKTDNGQLFLAMAYYEGQTVREKIKEKPLPLSEALDIALGMAQGLSKAHEKGVTHRDIKSENIIITTDGGVKIMDFGLAKIAGASTLTKTGATLGTVPYMSPEQARGDKLDHRTDIWSFGMVLYEMITGRLPFKSDYNDAVIYSILNQDPEPVTALRTGVPMELERIISKCLEKNASDRYQHMDDIIVDLQKVRRVSGEAEQKPPRRTRINIKWNKWLRIGVSAAIIALLLIFFFPFSKSPDLTIRSIAVLPLDNLSRDSEQEYFADGMTEALITDLAKISALRVISRTSVMLYKTRKKTIPEIAKELNVDAIVEGSVQRSGDRVRITAQLLHAPTDRHLWAESYERSMTDVLALQTELALAIAKEIRAKVTPQEETHLTSAPPVNKEAYELYLKGRYFWNKRTTEGIKKAIEQFQQAAEADPNYALAYVGLADCYAVLESYAGTPASEALPKAKAYAERALQLDETLAEAHGSLGITNDQLWQFEEAEQEYKRAISLNPNYPTARQWYSAHLRTLGRLDKALAEIKHAQELDPLSPVIRENVALTYLQMGDLDAAIAQARKIIELDSNYPGGHRSLGLVYLRQRRYPEAIAEFQKGVDLSGRASFQLSNLGYGYALAGKRAEALAIVKELEERYAKREASELHIAPVYSGLGKKDQAFAWLEKAFQTRSSQLRWTTAWPFFDSLRGDPRYIDLLQRVGLQTPETDKGSSSSSIEKSKTEPSLEWQNSIAVLPFKNISADKEQEYFCDGMTEQLITNLTSLPNVKVIARTSVMQFKNSDKTIQQIANELGVAHVLEGSVRKSGNKIRVTAQLINADDGFHLWAKDYDRQLKDIFAVQDDVSNAIVQALKVKLPVFLQHSMVATAPKNTEAYDLYLRGNFLLHKSDEESLNRALDYFQKSIEKDRSYALPYAGIANAYVYLADVYLPPNDAYPKAKSYALKALELDSTTAEARAALAYVLGAYERDQLSSQREFRRAMEFNPSSADLLRLFALYLGARTGSAEAIALADRALALDPLNPFASWDKECVLYMARQFDEVIKQHKRTVELDPNFFYGDSWVGIAYRERRMFREALEEYMKVQKLMPGQPLFGLAALYARMGKQREAKNILRNLINESTKRYIAPTAIAMVYIALGEKDLAFIWLDRAYESHDPFLDALKTDVRYDPIHSDPRYAVLVKKMGLEK